MSMYFMIFLIFSAHKWPGLSFRWAFVGHRLFSKSIKLVPYFFRNPQDMRYLPVSILFGYFHNFTKLGPAGIRRPPCNS